MQKPPFELALHLALSLKCPVRVMDSDAKVRSCVPEFPEKGDPLVTDPAFAASFKPEFLKGEPFLYVGSLAVCYAGLGLGEYALLAGPFVDGRDGSTGKDSAHALLHHASRTSLAVASPTSVLHALSLIYVTRTGKSCAVQDILDSLSEPLSFRQEQSRQLARVMGERLGGDIPHDDVRYETSLRGAIAAGDTEGLKRVLSQPQPGERPALAASALRAVKNQALVDLTVISRAAADAGVNAGEALELSAATILLVESADSALRVEALVRDGAFRFCALVKKTREQPGALQDELVAAIELYVRQNLHRSFSMEELARTLNFSHDHLMKLYKKVTGRTIMAYARHMRVEAAKVLLVSGRYAGAEIASMVGFSSQSHFIRAFKAETGLTPFKFEVIYEGRPFFNRGGSEGVYNP